MLQSFSRFFKTEAKKEEKVYRNNFHLTSQSFLNYQLDSNYNFHTEQTSGRKSVDLKNLFSSVKNLRLKDVTSNYHDNGKYQGYGGYGLFLTQRFSIQLMPFLNTEVMSITDKTSASQARRIRLNNFANRYLSNLGIDLHTDFTTNRNVNLGIGLIYLVDNRYLSRIEVGMNTPLYNAWKFNSDGKVSTLIRNAVDDVTSVPGQTVGQPARLNDLDKQNLVYYLVGGQKPNSYDRKKVSKLLDSEELKSVKEHVTGNIDDISNVNDKLILQSILSGFFNRQLIRFRRFFYIQVVSQNFNITNRIRFNVNVILGSVLGIGSEINLKNHVLF